MARYVNQYAAKCAYCRKRVDPYGGLCWKPDGSTKWVTAHEPCIPLPPVSKAPVAEPMTSGEQGKAPTLKITPKGPSE